MAYEVKMGTWEEFAEGELVRRAVAELGPRALLIDVSNVISSYSDYGFYKETEYDRLLDDLRQTGNHGWVRRLEEFKFSLRCAEEPIAYFVFWNGKEVVDIVAVVAFLDEQTANLVVYSLSDYR